MNCLVVGLGSIGERHARILVELGHKVSVVTRRKDLPYPQHDNLKSALTKTSFEYVVVSNPTNCHGETLRELVDLNFKGRALVEKPLVQNTKDLPSALPPPFSVGVGYNLRFHPLVQKTRDFLKGKELLRADLYCGSYLPDWRPDDYRRTASALKALGGGVLRVLSHEIDTAAWLAGHPLKLRGETARISKLEIDCEDDATMEWQSSRGAHINVRVNFFDRLHQRTMNLITPDDTVHVDLIRNTWRSKSEESTIQVHRDDTYRALHTAFLSGSPDVCSWQDGHHVVKIIEAVEQSSVSGKWEDVP